MNRFITGLNAVGVLALSALCVVQWRINERQNQEVIALRSANREQTAKLEESAKAYKGCVADLETLREQVVRTHSNLKDRQTQLLELERQVRQLSAERDQIKAGAETWQAAVAARDQCLQEANEKIQKLAADRNDAILKYNQIVEKYNATVKDLNAAVGRINKMAAAQQTANSVEQQKNTH